MILLHPCPGPTGRCTPVIGRREEGLPRRVQDAGKRIPEYQTGQTLTNINQNEGTIICNWYQRLKFIVKKAYNKPVQLSAINKYKIITQYLTRVN